MDKIYKFNANVKPKIINFYMAVGRYVIRYTVWKDKELNELSWFKKCFGNGHVDLLKCQELHSSIN